MKILAEYSPGGSVSVRSGWGHVFRYMGHEFLFWEPSRGKPAFDIFAEFEPDIFLSCTYSIDRAISKCIASRPGMKVALFASAWGPYIDDINLKEFPIVVVNDEEKRTIERLKKETGRPDFVFIHVSDRYLEGTMGGWSSIGVRPVGVLNAADLFLYRPTRPKPELACDAAMVGGFWPYKATNLIPWVFPLCHPSSGLSVKIFGNSPWPIPNYLGQLSQEDERALYSTASVCINISEPHSTSFKMGWDTIERPYKLLACKSFVVSDYVPEMANEIFGNREIVYATTPAEFKELIQYYVSNPELRTQFTERGYNKVIADHTYFDRVAKMLAEMNLIVESCRCMDAKRKFLADMNLAREAVDKL